MLRNGVVVLFLLVWVGLHARVVEPFNFDWKFHYGDVDDALVKDLDIQAWKSVDLPHDYQIEQPWLTPDYWGAGTEKEDATLEKRVRARGFKEMGTGWYRKSFVPKNEWMGKRLLLDFEGLMLVGDVWINGKRIGGSDYGYCGFEVDITPHVLWNDTNVVAVKTNTGSYGNSRWYTGGGLFREVHLLVKDAGLAFARHAVHIYTPSIDESRAEVRLRADIENRIGKSTDVRVRVSIFDPNGNPLGTTESRLTLNVRNKIYTYDLKNIVVKQPKFWDCVNPNLYKAQIELLDAAGKKTDELTETFGIRSIEFSPDFGFRLNGKKVLLKGIANHHSLGALGAAAYDRAIEKRFQLMKSFGINHVRCSHNLYSKSFMEYADQYGILVVDEVFDKWSREYAGGRVAWWDLWPKAVTEMIKRDRNHPSVIMWSLGNELQVNEGWTGYTDSQDWGVTAYRMMDVLVKRYDHTRPTTVAMFPRRRYNDSNLPPELAVVSEVSSFNYTYTDFRTDAQRFPEMILYQSEASVNGMGANFFGMDLDRVVGLAYWGLIDYLGESRSLPYKGWRDGVFQMDLRPKPQAYLLKSMFSEEPLVHSAVVEQDGDGLIWNDVRVGTSRMSDHWNHIDGQRLHLLTYTNADEVELFVNGKSFGRKPNPTDDIHQRNQVRWENIPYQRGTLVVVGYREGREVARHRMETTGKAVQLQIEPDDFPWLSNGMDVKHIRIYAVDSNGRRVPDANHLLHIGVEGDARIVGLDNGDLRSDELATGHTRSLYQGSALVILRSGTRSGPVRLTVSADGLRTAQKKIIVQ
ncbi:MAG: glycoside hydrolase family 2 TIM barrel-domain containing protein [Bacteroidales bacterium]